MMDRKPFALAALIATLSGGSGGGGLGCEREPDYEDAGERLDQAIERVERLKRELADAERELQAARSALGEQVIEAPSSIEEVAPANGREESLEGVGTEEPVGIDGG